MHAVAPADCLSVVHGRLEELQRNMVGGEQANNEEVKERRKKKKKYAEERRKKLLGEYISFVDAARIVCSVGFM